MGVQGILKQLFAAYPQAQVSAETVAVYLRLLADVPPADLQVAVDQAIVNSRFLPTVAELRDALLNLRQVERPSWTEAWDEVTRELRRVGSWGVPQFASPWTAQIVRAMGWRELCQSENPQTDRAQFRDLFNALATRQDQVGRLLPQSVAWAAEHRGAPVQIGDLLARHTAQAALVDGGAQ